MESNAIWGFVALCAFAFPFIALAGIILYKVYRKFRPARPAVRAEARREEKLVMPSGLPAAPGPLAMGLRFVALVGLAVLGGAFIGFAAGTVAGIGIYISIMFPLVMGAVGGGVLADGARRLRVGKGPALIALGVLLAVVTYATFHYGSYLLLQYQISAELRAEAPDLTESDSLALSRVILEGTFEEQTGRTGFAGYILYRAKKGVEVGKFYRSRTNLGPVLTWFYWLLEFVLILGAILGVGRMYGAMHEGEEVCPACGGGYRETHLGGAPISSQDDLLERVRRKEFAELGRMLKGDTDVPSLEVYLRGCEACNQGPARLIVRRASRASGGTLEFTDLFETSLPPGERVRLADQFRPASAPG
jgi:hypothetical protein